MKFRLLLILLLLVVAEDLSRSNTRVMAADLRLFETQHFVIGGQPEQLDKYGIIERDFRECGGWLETSYRVIVTDLKFREPWGFRANGRLLVKLEDFGESSERDKVYAETNLMSGVISLNLRFFRASNPLPQRRTQRVMQGTVAHELFHLVQLAYDPQEESWLREGTANWVAAQVFPDNHDIVDGEWWFLRFTQLSLHHPRKLADDDTDYWRRGRGYGTSLFFRYLTKHHDKDLVRRIWEYCAAHEGPNAMDAIVRVLAGDTPGPPTFVGKGAPIIGVKTGSPAVDAGLQAGDVIVTYNGLPIDSPEGLLKQIRKGVQDQWVNLTVRRDQQVLLLLTQLVERDSPTRGTVGYLGLKVDRSASNPSAISDIDISARPAVKAFDSNAPADTQAFRRLHDRFAVGCVLMGQASPACLLPDVDQFEKQRQDPTRGLAGLYDRGRITNLTDAWNRFYTGRFRGPDSSSLQFAFASSTPPDQEADGSIGGVGARCFQLPTVAGLAPNTPLQVLVEGAEHEVSLQGLIRRDPSAPWEVIEGSPEPNGGRQRLHIPRVDRATQEIYILLTRYADSYEGKVYPIQIAMANPPVLAELSIQQGNRIVYHEIWKEARDADGRPTGRARETVEKGPVDRSVGNTRIQLTFSQPVNEIPSQPICTVDGAVDVDLKSTDGGTTWQGDLPVRLLGPGDSHRVLVNAQAHPVGTKAVMPLDEDPGTIAVIANNGWSDYEHKGRGQTVDFTTSEGKPVEADKIVGKWWGIGGPLALALYKKNGGGKYVYDRKKQRDFLGVDPGPLSYVVIAKSVGGYRATMSGGSVWSLKSTGKMDDGKLTYEAKRGALREGVFLQADGSYFSFGQGFFLPDDKVTYVE